MLLPTTLSNHVCWWLHQLCRFQTSQFDTAIAAATRLVVLKFWGVTRYRPKNCGHKVMTVYFDFKANIKSGIEFKFVEWHPQLPLLAVGYSVPEPSQSHVTVLNQLVFKIFSFGPVKPLKVLQKFPKFLQNFIILLCFQISSSFFNNYSPRANWGSSVVPIRKVTQM